MENSEDLRKKNIGLAKQDLMRNGFPRLQISLIILLTALFGFLTSFLLLRAGIFSMTLRYPVAILAAYCIFLILLRIWLWRQSNKFNFKADFSGPDFGGLSDLPDKSRMFEFGGGGDFHGGGAGGSWGDSHVSSFSGGGSVFDGLSFDLDLEELWLVILAAAALIGGMLAALYIIYIAPVLLAEIVVDGILLTELYRRIKGIEGKSWLKTAVRKTIVPAILAILFFTIAGFAMQKLVPTAGSIGQVFNRIGER